MLMLDQLLKLFNSINPLSDELVEKIKSIINYKEFKKNSFVLEEGQVSNNVYFIQTGLVRSYYKKRGQEICSWFMQENDVIFSVKSFYTRLPSEESIQCIEDTTMLYITYDQLKMLYKTFLEFNIIGRQLTERYYMLSEDRVYSMRRRTSKERYVYFMKTQPVLARRVPKKFIATYLGISIETISRIKIR